MRALIASLLALALLLGTARSALGEPCTVPHHVLEGEPAPCEADLIPAEPLAKLIEAKQLSVKLQGDLTRAEAAAQAKLAEAESKLASCQTQWALCEADNLQPVMLPAESHWYASPVLWFVVGLGLGATVILTVN